jgi:SOS-response transcriptional repressor LexA
MNSAVMTQSAAYGVLQMELPGGDLTNIGVLLEDPATNSVHLRLRRDWDVIADEADAEILELLADDLAQKASEMGASAFFAWLEDTLSNTLRITDRVQTIVDNFDRGLNRLYREHVNSKVLRFTTHLPRYSLQVAAGKFLENEEVIEEGWEEVPGSIRLTPDMFIAKVVGRSMEPVIPDGSLCVFRHGVTGSRDNRLVLVEDSTTSGDNRYTVKRYKSKKDGDETSWWHKRIRLESLNPDFPSWDLVPEEEKYRIIAEFVQVL